MKFLSIVNLLLISSGSLTLAAPMPLPDALPPSAKALIDATNLICGQYPNRAWVLIGELKVDCEANIKAHGKRDPAEEEKRADTETSVDAGWIVEYGGGGNLIKREPAEEKRADTETSVDAGWIVEYGGGGNLI